MVRVIIAPNGFMKEYIAVHSLMPKNELPKRMQNLPPDTILIRENVLESRMKDRFNRTLGHEIREMHIMKKEGLPYKKAHRKAGY